MTCPNCGAEFEGERCPNCGRAATRAPLRTAALLVAVSAVVPCAWMGACSGVIAAFATGQGGSARRVLTIGAVGAGVAVFVGLVSWFRARRGG